MEIRRITQNAQREGYMPLLLLADPDESMICRYLYEGDLFVLSESGEDIGVAVVTRLDEDMCELKNIAILEKYHRRGYGSALLKMLFEYYHGRYAGMMVGTSDGGVAFYIKQGFAYHHTIEGFFVNNYPEPIYDDGMQCVDMFMLYRSL